MNAGNSQKDYVELQKRIPTFWPLSIKGPFGPDGKDQRLDWPPGGDLLFRAFRDYLRRLWRSDFYKEDGAILDGLYLEYVLGLETGYAVDPPYGLINAQMPDQSFRDGWRALSRAYAGAYVEKTATVLPQWGKSKFEYLGSRDFQQAAYLLLSESWRAKVCRRCRKYFIADIGAQVFCSVECSLESRLEGGRQYWHEKGAGRRERRTRKRGKK